MPRLIIQVKGTDIMSQFNSVVHMCVEYRVQFWPSHLKINSTELNKGMRKLPWNLVITRYGIFLEYGILIISVNNLLASSEDKCLQFNSRSRV